MINWISSDSTPALRLKNLPIRRRGFGTLPTDFLADLVSRQDILLDIRLLHFDVLSCLKKNVCFQLAFLN